jgi:hypothetical protein
MQGTLLSRLLKQASLRAEGKGLMAEMCLFFAVSPQPLALSITLSDSLKQAGNRCVREPLDGAGNRVSGFCRWHAAGP